MEETGVQDFLKGDARCLRNRAKVGDSTFRGNTRAAEEYDVCTVFDHFPHEL
jgi:hypothetical protein